MPRVVLLPTFHFQVTSPLESAVLDPNPLAVALPDLYSTSMLHWAFFVVLIVTEAVLLRVTLDVRFVTFTDRGAGSGSSVGSAVGFADGAAVGAAVGASVGVAVGDGTASAVGAGVATAVGVEAGVAAGAELGIAATLGLGDASAPTLGPDTTDERADTPTNAATTTAIFCRRDA